MNHPEGTIKRIWSEHWRFAVAVMVAAVVLVELMLRLFVMPASPPVKLDFDHDNRNCARPVPGSAKVWRPHGVLGKSVVHRINNLGVRDDVPDPGADLRVAVLGGSAVYGVGQETRDTLPELLESLFAGRYPDRRIRFLNFGFPGFDLEEQIRELARLEPVFKPDMVIVALDNESFQPPLCSRRALPARNQLNDNLALARFVERNLLPVDLVPGNAIARRATVADLQRLVRTLDSIHGGKLVFAALDDLRDVADQTGAMAKIPDVIERSGHLIVIPGVGAACGQEGASGDRQAQDGNSMKTTADLLACHIEPLVTGLISGD